MTNFIRKIVGIVIIAFGAMFLAGAVAVALKDGFLSVILLSTALGLGIFFFGLHLVRSKKPLDVPFNRVQDRQLEMQLFKKNSLHTLLLVAASVIPFLLINVALKLPHLTREIALAYGADFVPYVARGQVWRLLTGTFLHYDIVHLMSNMFALVAVGRYVDYYYGHKRLYFIYFATALAGSLTSNIANPTLWCVGASGAVFGLYGAFVATFFVKHPDKTKLKFSSGSLFFMGLHILRSLAAGFGQLGINNACHLGGFAAGVALGWALLSSEFDWDLVRNSTAGLLIGVFGIMQFTVYRYAPTEAQILAKEAQRKEWVGLAERGKKYSEIMVEFQAQVTAVQQKRISPEQFQNNWFTGLKPEIELLRMDLFTYKVTSKTAYQAQLDLYNSVLESERMLGNLFSGKREVASNQNQAVDTFKRALDTINANLMAEN